MKKLLLYVILILFEIAAVLAYGFIFRDIISIETCLIIAFFIPFILFVIFYGKEQGTIKSKLLKIVLLSLCFVLFFIVIFFSVNNIDSKFVGEYEVVVEYIGGGSGNSASFTTPDGEYGSVDLHDYRPILTDEDEYVTVGDTIRIKEYKGVFGFSYYVFVEEVYQNIKTT